jgi:hypothetical protein
MSNSEAGLTEVHSTYRHDGSGEHNSMNKQTEVELDPKLDVFPHDISETALFINLTSPPR